MWCRGAGAAGGQHGGAHGDGAQRRHTPAGPASALLGLEGVGGGEVGLGDGRRHGLSAQGVRGDRPKRPLTAGGGRVGGGVGELGERPPSHGLHRVGSVTVVAWRRRCPGRSRGRTGVVTGWLNGSSPSDPKPRGHRQTPRRRGDEPVAATGGIRSDPVHRPVQLAGGRLAVQRLRPEPDHARRRPSVRRTHPARRTQHRHRSAKPRSPPTSTASTLLAAAPPDATPNPTMDSIGGVGRERADNLAPSHSR